MQIGDVLPWEGVADEAERLLAISKANRESVCCLLVLNSVTSTPQWIRPGARNVHDVCVFVCKRVL
jgi:hypothetical protein